MARTFHLTVASTRRDSMRLGPVKPHRRTAPHLASTRVHRDERAYRRERKDWLAEV